MKKLLVLDISALALLGLLSCGVGFGIDQLRAKPLGLAYLTPTQRLVQTSKSEERPSAPPNQTNAPISREIQVVEISQLQEFLEKNQALVFDVRPDIFFKLGHIPGARSLQEKEFDADLVKAKPLIEAALAKGQKIVVYCSGSHCSDASKVAQKLLDLQYGNLMIFESGWEAWQAAGLKEEQEAL
jgi:rhodanese-related sulfurtransferase